MEVTMKYLYLVILLFLLTAETSAQNLSDSSGLSVLQKKWSIKSVYAPNSILNEDPLRAVEETGRTIREAKNTVYSNSMNVKKGLPPAPPPSGIRFLNSEKISGNSSFAYRYQLKVKNNGTKTIQSVTWNYIFLDPAAQQPVGQRQFISKTNLKPNKTANLVIHSYLPPTGVTYSAPEIRKLRNQYIEKVNIKSIQYKDGTVWQADSK
jgi:hypothetical protein